jgi:type IV pilus assembly protein PilM
VALGFKEKILNAIQGEPTTVGIDIGNYSIKIARVVHRQNGPVLLGAGIHVLKPDTIVGGEIKNREELLQSLTALVHRTDPAGKIKDVVLSLSWSYGVIADRIKLKSSKGESDEEVILMEAGQRSPFDVDNITLDYKILHKHPENDEMEVLLVAAKLQVMQSYIDLLYEAGLRPVVIDVDAFAVTNAYLLSAPPEDGNKVVSLINVGEHLTNLTFLKNGTYHSTRDIATACDFFVKTIMKNLKVEREEAANILRGKNSDKYNQATLNRSIEFSAEELSVGIDLAFSYFQSSENNLKVEKMVLCGGGACIRDLAGILAKRHNVEVEVTDPLAHILHDEKKFSGPIPSNISTILTVATGLALRRI